MFNKLKQFKELRHKAKTLQDALALEKVMVDKEGICLEMDGNQQITKLDIPSEWLDPRKKNDLEKVLTNLLSKGLEKTKTIMAQKLKSMGDFNLSNFGL